MRKVILSGLLLLCCFHLQAKDWTFNSLNRLYNTNPARCLERSKTYINYFPKAISPYYFASKVSLDEVEECKTSLSKYTRICAAIKFAKQFEEVSNDTERKELLWDEQRASLEIKIAEVHRELTEARQRNYANALLKKWPEIGATEIAEIEKVKLEPAELEGRMIPEINSPTIGNMMFYGMPSGKENISSFNFEQEKELLRLINAERIKKGQSVLEWNEDLARACRYHAMDLGTQDYFNHGSYDRVNGKLVNIGGTFDRIRKFYSKTFVNSENIAAGNAMSADTYQQWYTSKGHYDNMFNASSKKVGIGVVYVPESSFGYYWVFCTAE